MFQCESFDKEGCFEWCHFDLVLWIKAEWGEQVPSVVDMISDPGNIEIPSKPIKCRRSWVWKSPIQGS